MRVKVSRLAGWGLVIAILVVAMILSLWVLPPVPPLAAAAAQGEGAGESEHAREPPAVVVTMSSVLESAGKADWRTPRPENLLYMKLGDGTVIIELAPQFAPHHVANIRTLVREDYFDGLSVVRSQENYVVQWGDPQANSNQARSLGSASIQLEGEYFRRGENLAESISWIPLPDPDPYADRTGLTAQGMPAGMSEDGGRAWLAHCYGMVGAGRGMAPDSGNGAELYVVIGHAPRHLDRNVTLVGRVLVGMEHLSTLPRGTGDLGFYEKPEDRIAIESITLASDIPANQRTQLQVLRTDTKTYRTFIEARRHRREPWFIDPAGHVGLCNMPVPVREVD